MNNTSLNLIKTSFYDDSDVDELFERLEQFTPPANMVDRIMSAVSRLPFYSVPVSPWGDEEDLAIAE